MAKKNPNSLIKRYALSTQLAESIEFFMTLIGTIKQTQIPDNPNARYTNFTFYINEDVSIQSFLKAYMILTEATGITNIEKNYIFTPQNVNIDNVFNGSSLSNVEFTYKFEHFAFDDFNIQLFPKLITGYHLIKCRLNPLEYLAAIKCICLFGGYFEKTIHYDGHVRKYIFKKVGHFKKSFTQNHYRMLKDNKESVFYQRIEAIEFEKIIKLLDNTTQTDILAENIPKITAQYLEREISKEIKKDTYTSTTSDDATSEFKL